ncbi:synaptic vesicle glycoprotein 2B-like [Anticarsia gemmatalis]|uniref:synaptic vesicle glycoprotein 2B-like n=1 Tax=Anticarsia gemmatalis TaxID=129554 RepID=UPI003F76036E
MSAFTEGIFFIYGINRNKYIKMSELDLPAFAEAHKVEPNLTPLKEINAALKACTFGRFHIKLLFIAFLGFMSGVLVSSSTGYLLPVAECDLGMNLLQKGLLNAMPYIGMLLSSVIAGFLTDALGRKKFLVYGYGGIFLFTVIAASSQSFEVLLAAKFFEGLVFAACFSALLTMTAEFCHNEIRDRMMLCQSSFAGIAQVVVALMSWYILTSDWKITLFDGKYVLNTWNFYLYAVSLWSLAACVMYGLMLPESPKYLVTQKKYDEARDILIKIYVQNTGKPAETYPFLNIWKDKIKQALDEAPENQVKNTFSHQIVVGLHNIKPMFKKPLVVYLALIATTNFLGMAMYNVFRLWFPQLSAIVENYQTEGGHDLCVMLDSYTASLRASRNITTTDVCVATKSGRETYINSIIIGFVCLLPYFITGVLVNRVGKKPLLIVSGIIAVLGSGSLRWATNKIAIVALFSISIAISQVMQSLSQAVIVEVFGTTTRTLAISIMMVSGRVGTLTGNISFPILLDMGCVVPFFTIAGLMVVVTIIFFLLPTRKQQS